MDNLGGRVSSRRPALGGPFSRSRPLILGSKKGSKGSRLSNGAWRFEDFAEFGDLGV